MLHTNAAIHIVAEAVDGGHMLELLRTTPTDILITDIMMPGITGYDLAMELRKENPGIKIIALSMSEEGGMITKMIDGAQVDGYLPKSAGRQELMQAIGAIMNGEIYYSPVVRQQYDTYKLLQTGNEIFNLTARELQVIECITQHLSNRQIASKLFISERTVETHRKNIYRKTNTKGEASLVQFAKEHKLL